MERPLHRHPHATGFLKDRAPDACRAARTGKNQSRMTANVPNEGRLQFPHKGQSRDEGQPQDHSRFVTAQLTGRQTSDQDSAASRDLRGASSGIAPPATKDNRPRQNSQERSLSQPGSARSMTSTKRFLPTICSKITMSSKVPKFIACAIIRFSEGSSSLTEPHQTYFRPSSAMDLVATSSAFMV